MTKYKFVVQTCSFLHRIWMSKKMEMKDYDFQRTKYSIMFNMREAWILMEASTGEWTVMETIQPWSCSFPCLMRKIAMLGVKYSGNGLIKISIK